MYVVCCCCCCLHCYTCCFQSSIKYHDIRYPPGTGSSNVSPHPQLSANPSQATPDPPPPQEATPPTITVESPQDKGSEGSEVTEEGVVASGESVSRDEGIAQSTSALSYASNPTSSADTAIISPSHSQELDSTPQETAASEEDMVNVGGVPVAEKPSNQLQSPPIGDDASVVGGVAESSSTGSDVIASAAQIKVMEPTESAGSPTPARSGSPAPIPVTGDNEGVAISTRVKKSEAILPTSTSSTFKLKQGQPKLLSNL